MDSDQAMQRAPGVFFAPIEGETVLLDSASGQYYTIDEVGQAVWEAIGDGATFGEVCEAMVVQFDVDEATCKADVEAFCRSMQEAGLLSVA